MKYFYFTKLHYLNFYITCLHSYTQYFTALHRVTIVNSVIPTLEFAILSFWLN